MMFLSRAVGYARQCGEVFREFPGTARLVDLLRDFPSWYRNFDGKHTPLEDELPWLTFAAIRQLAKFLRPHMRVFEYGSGGSTLFFARRVAQVVTIEHDPHWSEMVSAAVQAHGYSHCELRLVRPVETPDFLQGDPSDPDDYITSDENFSGYSLQKYVSAIDNFADKFFDLICIDGRARPSCFKHALPKVALGGYIVMDNSDRESYQTALRMASIDFRRTDFRGPVPNLTVFNQTTIFSRERR